MSDMKLTFMAEDLRRTKIMKQRGTIRYKLEGCFANLRYGKKYVTRHLFCCLKKYWRIFDNALTALVG